MLLSDKGYAKRAMALLPEVMPNAAEVERIEEGKGVPSLVLQVGTGFGSGIQWAVLVAHGPDVVRYSASPVVMTLDKRALE